jgi:hypothetical protein
MKRDLRCHDFGSRTRSKARRLVILSKRLATKCWAKIRASPKGYSQNRRCTVAWSRDRHDEEQGPACGMRPLGRSWRVSFECRSCASSGSHPQGVPVPPSDAPRLRGCDREGAHKSRGIGAPIVALRGRIQAQCAWNLLRPPRDASLLGLPREWAMGCAERLAIDKSGCNAHVCHFARRSKRFSVHDGTARCGWSWYRLRCSGRPRCAKSW